MQDLFGLSGAFRSGLIEAGRPRPPASYAAPLSGAFRSGLIEAGWVRPGSTAGPRYPGLFAPASLKLDMADRAGKLPI